MDYVEPAERGIIWVWLGLLAGLAALVFFMGAFQLRMAVAAGEYVPGLYRAGAVGEPTICFRAEEVQDWIIEQLGMADCAAVKAPQLRRARGALAVNFPLRGGDLGGLANLERLTIRSGCHWWAESEIYVWEVLGEVNPAAAVTLSYQPAAGVDAEAALEGVALNLVNAGFGGGERPERREAGGYAVGSLVRVLELPATAVGVPGCPKRSF